MAQLSKSYNQVLTSNSVCYIIFGSPLIILYTHFFRILLLKVFRK